MATSILSQDRLIELLRYEPETGHFYWLRKTTSNISTNKPAGCKMKTGYLCIRVCNELHYCHRLAWLYMTGEWPSEQIDHINGNKSDNRFSNLRSVTQNQNCQLKHVASGRSKTGFAGVTVNERSGKFNARHKNKWLGTFKTPEEAHKAYVAYRDKLSASIDLACGVPSRP